MSQQQKKPARVTWKDMEPPLRETWGQVVQELTKRQQEQLEEEEGLITGLQADQRNQIYTGNSGDRSTGGSGGKSKKRRGWYKWLRRLKAREKNIPAQFYPDMEGINDGMENLNLEHGLEKNPLYDVVTSSGAAAVVGGEWKNWRTPEQK
uniref:Rev protein n=1 Tax=Visna-maedi virus TaxID=2169971 RepID=F5BDA2_9RETR|nr:rev protein [Visna-maedi virus]